MRDLWVELTTICFVIFQSGAVATVWQKVVAVKWFVEARWAGQPAKEIIEKVIGPSGSKFAN